MISPPDSEGSPLVLQASIMGNRGEVFVPFDMKMLLMTLFKVVRREGVRH